MSTRVDHLLAPFSKDQRLIELGPSYSPIAPKAAGWNVTTIDHATQAELRAKYGPMGAPVENIEPVDYVWKTGNIADLVGSHRKFDGFIASHVIEHMPDVIRFLANVADLLHDKGILMMAVPDKRFCFDFFIPHSTTSAFIEAHLEGRSRHRLQAFLNQTAYRATRGEQIGWATNSSNEPPIRLSHPLSLVREELGRTTSENEPYADTHGWQFTPASFKLLILELNRLKLTPWAVVDLIPMSGVEFLVRMERRALDMSEAEETEHRETLLREMVLENQYMMAQMLPPAGEPSVRQPTIAAIIPLYNGGKYIAQAINSILQQTLKPDEIVVVDDGSTDDGPAIVEKLAQSHPIRLLRKPNGGQSSARNFGVKHTTSELIALLDQDDVWYDNHLEELLKQFQMPTYGLQRGWVYSNLDEIDEQGRLIARRFLDQIGGLNHPKVHLFDLLRGDMFILPTSSLIARSAFEQIGGFDESLSGYEDDDLFLRMFRAGFDNSYIATPLSAWRIYPTSSSYTYRMADSRAKYARKLIAEFPDDPQRERYYVRDLIAPRFYNQALAEFQKAVKRNDPESMKRFREEILYFGQFLSIPTSRRMLRDLSLTQDSRMRTVLGIVRPIARPIIRRVLR